MSFEFRWNPYADQPHNIAPRKERFWYHFRHAGSYVSLAFANLCKARPILALYRKYRKKIYREHVDIETPFALSVSPSGERNEEVVEALKELGVRRSLIRIPSWEMEKLEVYREFSELLVGNKIELTIALLQQRNDVLDPSRWENFLGDVIPRFAKLSSFFEIGHAWNRTKWGVWDYKEYLKLAYPAMSIAEKYNVELVGPAVIDFEFHLYPPVLRAVPFDKISSLLYVDRMGAPENTQFGWDTSRKIALLKAVVDGSSQRRRDLWITEVNWPLKGTGKYSPASGKPNVSEEEQANYLVRYNILCAASGFVDRIYWWQLVAPGYGLVDSREKEWRKRPSFYAMKTIISQLERSTFTGRVRHQQAEIFAFHKGEHDFAVCWTNGPALDYSFAGRVRRILDRDGKEIPSSNGRVTIEESPKYVFLK
ncbi:MAG: hypothetical protein JSV96_17465 [Candidatus Aminicenantes bacterium]|nr:MAG: hypothetical protein JSV96_17465 [Candidatus Aminicenantes bacterium]